MPKNYSSIVIDGYPIVQLARQALGEHAVEQAQRAGANYEQQVHEILTKIDSKKTGQAVLRAIERHKNDGYSMRIEPYLTATLDEDPNAYAIPEERVGKWQAGREGRRRDSIIQFTPAHWGKSDTILKNLGLEGKLKHGPGNEPDEMLLHEMVHCLRIMSGVGRGIYSRRAVPGQAQYDTMEEFYAILIANIYRSECGRLGLRWDHSRFFIAYDVSDAKFLKTELNRRHLRQLRRQDPLFFNDLNNVKAPFNPTRAFEDG